MRRVHRSRPRVEILKRRQLAYWCGRFGVSVEELRLAVLKVGTAPERVAAELGKQP